jgi:protein-tyrosine phosphatase
MNWIADHFGSRRGFLRPLTQQAACRVRPGAYRRPPLSEVTRLVFICKGNICRSAFAESVAASVEFPACSYGFETHVGKPANPGMAEAAKAAGIDLSGHRTTPLSEHAALPGDLVLLFESGHLPEVEGLIGKGAPRALLGMWATPPWPYIHDPFGASPAYYEKAANTIRQATLNLVIDIRAQHDQ